MNSKNSSRVKDFTLTKSILKNLNVSKEQIDLKETRYLLYPLDYVKEENGSSLTLLQPYNSQLRYPMIDRAKKYLRLLANQVKNVLPQKLIVSIDSFDEIFEGDKIFIDYLSQYTGIVLEMTGDKNSYASNFRLFDEDGLNEMGLKYMSCGNSWTARDIYLYLVDNYNKPEYILNLAAVYNQLYEVEKTEYYLEIARKSGDKKIIVEANYMLAMLFARHHKKYLINDSYSKLLLNEAYNCFGSELTINKIFNRNGYALLLFKERRIDEAISMLNDCISSLRMLKQNSDDPAIEIHESVLIYNILQCYIEQGEDDQVDMYFRELELLDPNFIEYKIEYARYLLDNNSNNFFEVIDQIICFGEDFPEIYSLLGFYYYKQNNLQDSLTNYKKAYYLSDRSFDFWYDLQYIYVELNMYEKAQRLLEQCQFKVSQLDLSFLEDYLVISLEILYNCNKFKQMQPLLKILDTHFSDNEKLSDMKETLESEVSEYHE